MSNMPTFNFADKGQLDATPEEVAKAETRVDTRFKPGVYDLKVLSCTPHKQSEKDSNWWVYKALLTVEGTKVTQKPNKDKTKTFDVAVNDKGDEVTSITVYPIVPVNGSIKYNAENSKAPLFVFSQFKKFMSAIGVHVESTYESVRDAVMGNFAKAGSLDGRIVKAEIGYSGPYMARNGDVWNLYQKDGTLLTEETFPSRDLAEAFALEKGLTLQQGVEVLKYFPTDAAKGSTPAAKAGKVAW